MKHTGKTFQGQRIVTDGNQYSTCTFQNCQIVYEGGPAPSFENCRFDQPSFSFDGAAANTVTFLRALMRDPGMAPVIMDLFPEIRPRQR